MKLHAVSVRAMNKGSGDTVISVLGVAVTAVVLVIFITQIVPGIIGDAYGTLSIASAEVVSRNLAGLITASAAAPNEITINYQPSETHKYAVATGTRTVGVQLLTETFQMKGIIVSKLGIDCSCRGLAYSETKAGGSCWFSDVNDFTIEKSQLAAGYACNIRAK